MAPYARLAGIALSLSLTGLPPYAAQPSEQNQPEQKAEAPKYFFLTNYGWRKSEREFVPLSPSFEAAAAQGIDRVYICHTICFDKNNFFLITVNRHYADANGIRFQKSDPANTEISIQIVSKDPEFQEQYEKMIQDPGGRLTIFENFQLRIAKLVADYDRAEEAGKTEIIDGIKISSYYAEFPTGMHLMRNPNPMVARESIESTNPLCIEFLRQFGDFTGNAAKTQKLLIKNGRQKRDLSPIAAQLSAKTRIA